SRILRRMIYVDGIVDRDHAEWLIAIRRAVKTPNETFCSLYIEALVDYLVYQERPTGIVTDEAADWLLSKLPKPAADTNGLDRLLIETVLAEATRCADTLVARLDAYPASAVPGTTVILATERFALSA
ncbi:MAG: hypothetical protein ACOVOI_17670, partial [Hyphomicrobiales bacterium]